MTQEKKMLGIGYQDARKQRIASGYAKSGNNGFEAKGNEEYLIYFGRAHVSDFESGVAARGMLKVGRGKFKTALQRGRNQPGIDFRIYAEIILSTNDATHKVEKLIKENFKERNIPGSQGQRELYDFTDAELADFVHTVVEMVEEFTNVKIKKVNFY
jgi:hypothetical protein